MLAFEFLSAEDIAGEVKRISTRNVSDTEFLQPSGEHLHGETRSTPGSDRILPADLAGQFDEWSVEFVLNKRRTGDSRPVSQTASVDQSHFHSLRCQNIGDGRSGNSSTHNQNVCFNVLC